MLNFFVNFPISFLIVYGGCVDIISTQHLIVKSNRGEFAVTDPVTGVTVPTNQTEGDRLLIRLVTFTIASFSGAKEVDIAATLEHIRDQRMLMAKTKVTYLLIMAHALKNLNFPVTVFDLISGQSVWQIFGPKKI